MNLFPFIHAAESAAESIAESIEETASEAIPTISMLPEDFAFDYSLRVPVLSIIMMFVALILVVGVPLVLIIYTKKRFPFQLYALAIGFVAYMLGVSLLPSLLTNILGLALHSVFETNPLVSDMIYGILVTVFCFLSIYIGLRFCFRKMRAGFPAAIYFGVAMGLMPILTQGFSYILYCISASFSINQGQLINSVTSMIESGSTAEDIQSGLDSMALFIQAPATSYLMTAIDEIVQLLFFTGLCITIVAYISGAAPRSGLYKALLVQAAYGAFFLLRISGICESTVLYEILNIAVAALALVIAYLQLKTCMPDDLKKFLGKPDPTQNNRPGKKDPPHKMPKIVMPKD